MGENLNKNTGIKTNDEVGIALSSYLLGNLNLKDNIVLKINTLGDYDSMCRYKHDLMNYLLRYKGDLSDISRLRLERNSLRILDAKDTKDLKILQDAPTLNSFLNHDSRKYYDDVLSSLNNLGINFVEMPKLVRGLDYYCHTVFEFETSCLGSKGAILGGGHYTLSSFNNLNINAVGVAGGIERLMSLLNNNDIDIKDDSKIYCVPIGTKAEAFAPLLIQKLRMKNHNILLEFNISLKERMYRANKLGFDYVDKVYIIPENADC